MPDSNVYPPNPSGPVQLGQSGAAVSHTGDTTETVLATIAVPANLLGKNGRVAVSVGVTHTGTAGAITARVYFGTAGQGLGGALMGSRQTASTAMAVLGLVEIKNLNATNSQASQPAGLMNTPYLESGSALQTATKDTTAACEVVISGQLANGADTITLVSFQVLAYPHA